MKKLITFFGLGVASIVLLGAVASQTVYHGTFIGDGSSLTNMTAATVGAQPASANLTNWSSIATGTKQGSSANLTNLASVVGLTTNFQTIDEAFTNTLYITNGLIIKITVP